MELFGLTALDWGLVALIVFPLAQLPLVFYLARYVDVSEEGTLDHAVEFRDAAPDDSPNTGTGDASQGFEPERTPGHFDRSRSRGARHTGSRRPMPSWVVCYACGVENDPGFTYCRSCVERLSNSRPVTGSTPPQ